MERFQPAVTYRGRKRLNPIMFAQVINTCGAEEALMRCVQGSSLSSFTRDLGLFFEQGGIEGDVVKKSC